MITVGEMPRANPKNVCREIVRKQKSCVHKNAPYRRKDVIIGEMERKANFGLTNYGVLYAMIPERWHTQMLATFEANMTLDDLLYDLHSLEQDLRTYERKYGVRTETFFESYSRGEEPADDAWVLDWAAWASAYKIFVRLQEEYDSVIERLRSENSTVADVIAKTARHESIPIAA